MVFPKSNNHGFLYWRNKNHVAPLTKVKSGDVKECWQ